MDSPKFTVAIDGREKDKVAYDFERFPVDTESTPLETGDYSIIGYEDQFAVERKSADDLARCCGSHRDRFNDQIARGGRMENFVVIVEAPREYVENGRYYSGIHPNSVTGTIDAWSDVHGVDFIFCIDAERAEVKTFKYLNDWYSES